MINLATTPLGPELYTRGYSMKCKPVLCLVTLIKTTPQDQYGRDCVIETDNLKMLCDSATLYETAAEVPLTRPH